MKKFFTYKIIYCLAKQGQRNFIKKVEGEKEKTKKTCKHEINILDFIRNFFVSYIQIMSKNF